MPELSLWPQGGSACAALVREKDWAATPLGSAEGWPAALRTVVDMLLACSFPMVAMWGPELVQIYNDGYAEIMAEKHPVGMGQANWACWPELWTLNEPVYERVRAGETVNFVNQLLPTARQGVLEDAFFTLCCSPLRTAENEVGGVLVTVVETTQRVDADLRAVPLLDSAGNITQRERSEAALRASEARFRLFVENVREYALVQTDFAGVVTSWNPGAERLFGYRSEEILGKPFVLFLPGEDRPDGLVAREMLALSEGGRNIDAHSMQRKDGSFFWAEWVTEPVRDDAGVLRGTAKIIRDETERQRADDALRATLAEKEALLSEVHHRVKNNLQVITSMLNLQSRGLHDSSAIALFDETRNRIQAIASIHEMLYRSSNFANVDIFAYATELIPGLVTFYSAQTRVRVQVEGSSTWLELERAIPFGLLLNELVSNALKHGLPDPVTGSLHALLRDESGDILLTLSNSGRGLPSGFGLDGAKSLGLRLVGILVKQLNGSINFRADAGTTVSVRIPRSNKELS